MPPVLVARGGALCPDIVSIAPDEAARLLPNGDTGMMCVAQSHQRFVGVIAPWSLTVNVMNVCGPLDTTFGVLAKREPRKIVVADLSPLGTITALCCCATLPVCFPCVFGATRLAG